MTAGTDNSATEAAALEATFAAWRDSGRQTIRQNHERFRQLVNRTRDLAQQGRLDEAAVRACEAAYHANFLHCGMFTSPELEDILIDMGRQAVRRAGASLEHRKPSANSRRVLHVATNVAGLGGIPRLSRRWMVQDKGRVHSLALTKQAPEDVPEVLCQTVRERGGAIHVLNDQPGGLIARAMRLRKLAATADVVVLHIWEQDVLPLLAFAEKEGCPPVIYVNHGDHCFWMGAGVVDVLANLRESGRQLSAKRRGIAPERNLLVPTILEPLVRTLTRTEAKAQLGLPEDCLLLLSVARAAKYIPAGGQTFAEAHLELLQRHPRAVLMVVGPESDESWHAAARACSGRIRVPGPTLNTAVYYQAADVYVDSYPLVSITSLLEAGSYGVPLVSRFPYSGECGILGADMPGLTENLINTRNAAEYGAAVTGLLADEQRRLDLGAATRDAIARHHRGDDWQRQLENIYEQAAALPSWVPPTGRRDEMSLDEPDVFLPHIYGNPNEAGAGRRLYYGALPLLARAREWRQLGREAGHRLPLSCLLPEWLRCRYVQRHARKTNSTATSRS